MIYFFPIMTCENRFLSQGLSASKNFFLKYLISLFYSNHFLSNKLKIGISKRLLNLSIFFLFFQNRSLTSKTNKTKFFQNLFILIDSETKQAQSIQHIKAVFVFYKSNKQKCIINLKILMFLFVFFHVFLSVRSFYGKN